MSSFSTAQLLGIARTFLVLPLTLLLSTGTSSGPSRLFRTLAILQWVCFSLPTSARLSSWDLQLLQLLKQMWVWMSSAELSCSGITGRETHLEGTPVAEYKPQAFLSLPTGPQAPTRCGDGLVLASLLPAAASVLTLGWLVQTWTVWPCGLGPVGPKVQNRAQVSTGMHSVRAARVEKQSKWHLTRRLDA